MTKTANAEITEKYFISSRHITFTNSLILTNEQYIVLQDVWYLEAIKRPIGKRITHSLLNQEENLRCILYR